MSNLDERPREGQGQLDVLTIVGLGEEKQHNIIETTIEACGDYIKYENRKFFENYHNLPIIEAKLFRGYETDDESMDEEFVQSLKVMPKQMAEAKEEENEEFIHEVAKLSTNDNDDYEQITKDVISKLHELGMSKQRNSRIRIIENPRTIKKTIACMTEKKTPDPILGEGDTLESTKKCVERDSPIVIKKSLWYDLN